MSQVSRSRRAEGSAFSWIVRLAEVCRMNTVRNLDAWYPAFDVKPDDKLYLAPDQRVRIW